MAPKITPPEEGTPVRIDLTTETTNVTKKPLQTSSMAFSPHVYKASRIGMAANTFWPVWILCRVCLVDHPDLKRAFLAVMAMNWILAFAAHGMRTLYCVLIVPLYMTSLLLVFALKFSSASTMHPILVLLLSCALFNVKVAVCMSVCLHRYISHAAFKCGSTMRFFLFVLGCSANQRGPIWWASMHRRHHKYCDVPKDPHSALQDGTEKAFAFFLEHIWIDEEFVPHHCDTRLLRVLDLFSWVVGMIEMVLWYNLAGPTGLFIAYTSNWMCQSSSLWFNVANHPVEVEKDCKASNEMARQKSWYPAFILLDFLVSVTGLYIGESNHDDHHAHMALAKRNPEDLSYWGFVWPLEKLGLIWNVKHSTTA